MNREKAIGNLIHAIRWNDMPKKEALEMAIKALEQDPCEDAISRQAVLNALYALCDTGESLKENPWRDNPHIDAVIETIEELPPVAHQPCEDCISKTEVIKSIDEREDVNGKVDAESVRTDIALMPPVTPQPKTGHWIVDRDDSRRWDKVRFSCSECGSWQTYGKTDYCPNCGTKMVEPQERSDKE